METRRYVGILALLVIAVLVVACGRIENSRGDKTPDSTTPTDPTNAVPEYDIVTLLPPDGIPAIYDPKFLTPEEATQAYAPDELVLGVEIEGDARAYSLPFLSGHEIVNDTVAGRPIAVTW